ncbi:hypothetical protein ES703_08875 [subsurface metagenome]
MKRFFIILLVATVFFIAGVAVGRFVMPRKVEIVMIDIKDLVDIIERYNKSKHELEKIRLWNDEAMVKPEPEEEK